MKDIKCIFCDELITYDDYYAEWQHIYSGDPQCKDKNDEFLYTAAKPKE